MNCRGMMVGLALTACLVLPACGGDEKLSKSDLAKKADKICKKADTEAKGVTAPSNLDDADAVAAYFDKVVPIAQKLTDDLADLKPADDVKDDWNAVIDKQKEGNDLLKTIRDKAKAKDESGKADLQKLQTAAEGFSTAAKKVGANGCAS